MKGIFAENRMKLGNIKPYGRFVFGDRGGVWKRIAKDKVKCIYGRDYGIVINSDLNISVYAIVENQYLDRRSPVENKNTSENESNGASHNVEAPNTDSHLAETTSVSPVPEEVAVIATTLIDNQVQEGNGVVTDGQITVTDGPDSAIEPVDFIKKGDCEDCGPHKPDDCNKCFTEGEKQPVELNNVSKCKHNIPIKQDCKDCEEEANKSRLPAEPEKIMTSIKEGMKVVLTDNYNDKVLAEINNCSATQAVAMTCCEGIRMRMPNRNEASEMRIDATYYDMDENALYVAVTLRK